MQKLAFLLLMSVPDDQTAFLGSALVVFKILNTKVTE